LPSRIPPVAALFLSCLGFSLLFLAFPGIDLWANGLLHAPGEGFLLKGNAFFDAVHEHVGILIWLLMLGGFYLWLPDRLGLVPERLRRWRRAAAFVMLVVLLGPGLLVNVVFKDHWGRARPAQVDVFGGKARFTPAWVVSDQCRKNCSFVCGDASVGYALLAFAFFCRRPRLWLGIGIGAGSALGLMRMGQGGHFLSDVIFSFYAVYFTAWLLQRWMTRAGRSLRPAP